MRFASKIFSLLFIAVLLAGMVGYPNLVGRALSTSIDDIPGAPIALADASCGAPITRNIVVASSFIIADLNVGVNVAHDRRSDVRVTLESPSGTLVVLISGGGLGSPALASPDTYESYDVLLDDTSINSLYDNDPDATAAPFYDRNARPFELLSTFKGEDAQGTWILRICDTLAGGAGGAIVEQYNRAQLNFTSADPNTISGTVFTDYNDNGLRGTGDLPVQGVTATAYDDAGAVVGTDVTDANGAYSLNIPDGSLVRIEFSTIPTDLRPGAFGRDSGTTVQFVTSPAAGVDMGLVNPEEYCQNNPFLVMPCYINGDPLGGGSAGTLDVVVSIPNNAYGRTDVTIERTLATGGQVGTTWGLAYQRSTNTVYAGALAKRHSGLGTLGAGGIYRIVVDPQTGLSTSVSGFLDITTLGIPVGSLPSNAARGLPAVANTPNTDPVWNEIGKAALGDLDIGADDDTLWLVNLANQSLYRINDITAGPVTADGPYSVASALSGAGSVSPNACPAASDVRPWAVEVYKGEVYVGVVCTAESTQNVSDLRAYIIKTSEATPGTFTLAFEFALNYPRGVVSDSDGGYPAEWRPWSPTITSLCANPCATTNDLAFDGQIIYPQPILSDIEFDTSGDLILGLMDRTGHQTGNANYATTNPWGTVTLYNKDTGYTPTVVNFATDPAGLYEGAVAGDILRACLSGGVFVLENNATCGGITTGGNNSAPGQGPGNGEYYWQDMYPVTTDKNGGSHDEVTLGGLVLFPGTDEIAVSMYDPFAVRSGGISWFSNSTGVRSRAYEIFGVDSGGGSTTFGKAAGIGDIEGFCYGAPIEVGNRVWNDTNNNGIQEPSELPIAGVDVELLDSGGNVIATVTTDANGNYFFSSGPGTDTGNQEYLIPDLLPNSDYTVRIPNISGGSQQAALAGLSLSPNDTDADQRDSDATVSGTDAVIPITTGNPGENNHTYDFGFGNESYSLGNRVWYDTNNNGSIDVGTEQGITGVRVELYLDDGDGVFDAGDTFQSFDTTDANGYYRFDNLPAGEYVVVIPTTQFGTGGALDGYWSSGTQISSTGVVSDSTANDVDTDVDDSDENGISTLTGNTLSYVSSAAVTLGPGSVEPLNEPDAPNGQGAVDGRGNMTVDFGFYRVEVGDLVFVDSNDDGDYDAGTDSPLAGALVQLFASDGTTEIITGADGIPGTADDGFGPDGISGNGDDGTGGVLTVANGLYEFSGLPAGDYVVKVTPPTGYASTRDTADATDTTNPNTNTNNNDNGIGTGPGQVTSNVVTLTPGSTGAQSNNTVSQPTGTTSNPTVDFGFRTSTGLNKSIVGTSETFTSGYNLAIGEIVSYEVSFDLPVGVALNNVTVTDRMDRGLAYVNCLSVQVAGVNQTGTVCPSAVVSPITNPGDSVSNPANPGRQVQFNLGNIPAQTGSSAVIIRYRAIVLDVIENQAGGTLNNDVVFAWDAGSFSTSAPDATIVEAEMNIAKTVTPATNVAVGTPVQFTLTIGHSAQSGTDAYDVVVTDIIPSSLQYIPCSIQFSGLAPTTPPVGSAYCPGAATDLIFEWDVFPRGQTATITFNAYLLVSPATNVGSVAWTSLPIDLDQNGLPQQLSIHNAESTERWYDPGDPVNVYGVSASAVINAPTSGVSDEEVELPEKLPDTGFVPGSSVSLPNASDASAYKQTGVWLEIPRLGVNTPIVGVPLSGDDWDVSWLGSSTGWLEGTAFPTWQGNSVVTGHVTLPSGTEGPFAELSTLGWGDRVIVHAYGNEFIYEVRQTRTVSPFNTTVLQHEDEAWLTLLTCKTYIKSADTYLSRVAVRAVLIDIREDEAPIPSGSIR